MSQHSWYIGNAVLLYILPKYSTLDKIYYLQFRSSRPLMLSKKLVLKNFAKKKFSQENISLPEPIF